MQDNVKHVNLQSTPCSKLRPQLIPSHLCEYVMLHFGTPAKDTASPTHMHTINDAHALADNHSHSDASAEK